MCARYGIISECHPLIGKYERAGGVVPLDRIFRRVPCFMAEFVSLNWPLPPSTRPVKSRRRRRRIADREIRGLLCCVLFFSLFFIRCSVGFNSSGGYILMAHPRSEILLSSFGVTRVFFFVALIPSLSPVFVFYITQCWMICSRTKYIKIFCLIFCLKNLLKSPQFKFYDVKFAL